MDAWQNRIYETWRRLRDRALGPIALIFDTLKVSPNMVTASGIVAMSLFVVFVRQRPSLALIFIFLAVICDMLDGVLARYQKLASPRGKLIDISADALNFCLFVLGLAWIGIIPLSITLSLIISSIISRILRVIYHQKSSQNPKIFYPIVGFLPNFIAQISYGLGILDILTKNGIISSQIWIGFVLILSGDSINYYLKIIKR